MWNKAYVEYLSLPRPLRLLLLVQIRYQISRVVEAGAGVGVVKGREIPNPF
jgi:hypothetical protein